jgi:1,4-dihydroxy-2-naphthoyl-CoA hydrolase
MFKIERTVRLHDTDAGGVVYFAHQLRIAHEAFEAFLDSVGIGVARLIDDGCHLPIVHAEADFTAPLRVGDLVTVEVAADRIGETSFTVLYRFLKSGRTAAGNARTVHVALDAKAGAKRKIPEPLRAALKSLTETRT